MNIRKTAPFLLVLALMACGTPPHRSPVVTPQPMSCTGNVPAAFTVHSPEDAVLSFEGKSYDLKRAPSTTGAKYANSRISLWNKGVDAMITRADGSITTCAHLPKAGF